MTKVYLVEVRGNIDYSDQFKFFGVYADKAKAESVASELRCKTWGDELFYEGVLVSEVPIL